MDNLNWLALTSRWLHLIAVIVAVGGVFFVRLVLMPSAKATLDPATHEKLRQALFARWRMIVHSCVGILLLTGFYNLYAAMTGGHQTPLYNTLFGIKFLLALAIFFFAMMLPSSRSIPWLHNQRGRWLAVVIVLAVTVIAISGILKSIHVS